MAHMVTAMNEIRSRVSELDRVAQVGLGVGSLGLAYLGYSALYRKYRVSLNNARRRHKQAECKASIESVRALVRSRSMNDEEVEHITSLTLLTLRDRLQAGSLSPVQVLRAFQAKALAAHDRTNCLVEFIMEAEEWAEELERRPREGILWGIPISLKDDVGIKGYDTCMGEIERVGHPASEDSNIVKVLRSHGAIPFVKTNVPQSLVSVEPGNPINGTVRNPRDLTRGPGGSSSGEAALIAGGGSILGIGSDLGSSVRVPAHFCGLFTLKPTAERMSIRGMAEDGPDVLDATSMFTVQTTWGPMARDADSLVLTMKALWDRTGLSYRDPACVPLLFDDKVLESTRKLRIGYFTDNGTFPTFSACVRAVEMAKDSFIAQGHEVVPWEFPDKGTCHSFIVRLLRGTCGTDLHEQLKYDTVDPTVAASCPRVAEPPWYRRILITLLRLVGSPDAKGISWSLEVDSVPKLVDLIHQLRVHRRLVAEEWKQAGLDLVICPPHVLVAPPLGSADLLWRTGGFTSLYSMLHYPSGVVPMTTVMEDDLSTLDNDFSDTDYWQRKAKQALRGSMGLPVGVMVSASCYQDELCLRGMKILEDGKNRGSLA